MRIRFLTRVVVSDLIYNVHFLLNMETYPCVSMFSPFYVCRKGMEWLCDADLTKKRKQLKPAETRVTTCEGKQYVESREQLHSNVKQIFSGRPPKLVLERTPSPGFVVDDKPDLHIGVIDDHILIGDSLLDCLSCACKCSLYEQIFWKIRHFEGW